MIILITGATGLIGSELKNYFSKQDHTVRTLTHRKSELQYPDTFFWDPAKGEIDKDAFFGVDAVIHLAGCSIFTRWTSTKKAEIYTSRVEGGKLITEAVLQMDTRPKVILTASGINYYGKKRIERIHEESTPGEGFLAEVSQAWEKAFDPLIDAGLRIVYMRTSMVLAEHGGALPRILTPFKLGLGGRLGRGTQWMSWIAIKDLVRAYDFCLTHEEISGAVNAVSPKPVSNFTFKETLAQTLKKPTLLPLPTWFLKLIFGQLAEETMLSSLMAIPQKLLSHGFKFEYPDLKRALKDILHK